MDYKWVFDGIGGVAITLGVAAIVGAIRLAIRWQKKRLAANAPKPPPVYTRISALTAQQVWEAIDNAPVLHRNSVHKQYIGTVVRWSVHLKQIFPDDKGGRATLSFLCGSPSLEVVCEVRIADFPELGFANYQTPIVVTGKIGASKYGYSPIEKISRGSPAQL